LDETWTWEATGEVNLSRPEPRVIGSSHPASPITDRSIKDCIWTTARPPRRRLGDAPRGGVQGGKPGRPARRCARRGWRCGVDLVASPGIGPRRWSCLIWAISMSIALPPLVRESGI